MYLIDQGQLPNRLREEGLRIEVYEADQLPEDYIEQLVKKSRQPHVMKFEGHEDAGGRFKDLEAYRNWATKNKRIVYLLLADRPGKSADVGGIIWFGDRTNPHAPGYDVTYGVRLYDEDQKAGWGKYLGKGLAIPFLQATHADARKYFPNRKIWLDYVKGNEAARHTYEKFGYKTIAEVEEEGRVVMGHDTVFSTQEGDGR